MNHCFTLLISFDLSLLGEKVLYRSLKGSKALRIGNP